jgi:hypothetical protein
MPKEYLGKYVTETWDTLLDGWHGGFLRHIAPFIDNRKLRIHFEKPKFVGLDEFLHAIATFRAPRYRTFNRMYVEDHDDLYGTIPDLSEPNGVELNREWEWEAKRIWRHDVEILAICRRWVGDNLTDRPADLECSSDDEYAIELFEHSENIEDEYAETEANP